MKFFDKYLTVYFVTFFLLLVLWSGFLFLNQQKTTQWNYLFNVLNALLYFSGGGVAFFGTKLHGFRSSVGRELFAIGVGMVGFGIGLCTWSYYNLGLKVEVPYPSLADMFFLLYIPFIGYGILNLLREFGLFFSKRILFEAIATFVVSSILIFFFGNPPDLSDSVPFIVKATNTFYLMGDAFLLTLGIMLLRLTEGRIHKSFFYFIGALFAMATADFVFAHRVGTELYWNGDISDVLFGLSGLLFSLGVSKVVTVQLKILRGTSS